MDFYTPKWILTRVAARRPRMNFGVQTFRRMDFRVVVWISGWRFAAVIRSTSSLDFAPYAKLVDKSGSYANLADKIALRRPLMRFPRTCPMAGVA